MRWIDSAGEQHGTGAWEDPSSPEALLYQSRIDAEEGNPQNYIPANAVGMVDQATIDYFKSQNPNLSFNDPIGYYNWLFGGGSVGPSSNPEQDTSQYFYPSSGDINKFVNTPLNYSPATTGFNGFMEKAIPATILGMAGAGMTGLLPGTTALGGAGAGAAGAGAAGGASDLGWAANLTDAAGGSLGAPAGAGSAYAGLGGAGAAGGAGGVANLVDAGIQAPAAGTYQASGAAGGAGGGFSSGSGGTLAGWNGADATLGSLGAGGGALGGLGGAGGWLGNLGTIGTIGSALSGAIGAGASLSAANTQAEAANNATNAQLGMFNTINSQQAPWRAAGQSALGDIQSQQPYFQHQFNAQDLNANLAPNYQFMLDQGLTATKNAANLQSGLVSGNTLKGINDYAQNYAGNAYQQAFNNYSANQTNIFNRLSNIAGLGQTANASVANAGSSISPGVANTMVGQGAAQAAGTIGATNAVTGGLNNAMGWYSLGNLLGQ